MSEGKAAQTIEDTAECTFMLNGHVKKVTNPDPKLALFDYLHSNEVGLIGTKTACRQGGFVLLKSPV
jgi:xanthine dehydrogenase iron-sulfur cluster and FAD-binding subunit A